MKTAGAMLLLLWLGLLVGVAESEDIDIVELKYIRSQVQDFESRLQASETKARRFEKEMNEVKTKLLTFGQKSQEVAFTAALQPSSWDQHSGFGSIGPYDKEITLVHQNVLTNVGGAYNSNTGVFTAPVRGVYFFTFTTYSWVREADIGVKLMKNLDEVLLVWEWQDKDDNEDYASNSVLLELQAEDRVYMRLPKGFRVAGAKYNNIHTFSGFLLFPK
ncbi:hypothetical protein ACEWY4_021311 [Coilia grayii]|uniref:C1q domain-containing protein n=1 Tax=Coilia grayii TaxID=363190 RepID=A0ABD1JC07_9TELE